MDWHVTTAILNIKCLSKRKKKKEEVYFRTALDLKKNGNIVQRVPVYPISVFPYYYLITLVHYISQQ